MHTVWPATTFDTTIAYPSTDYPVPAYTTGSTAEQTAGRAFFTSSAILHTPNWTTGAGRPGIIACHGAGQSALAAFQPGTNGRWGDYLRSLVDSGFVVLAIDCGTNSNGNNLVMRAMDQAFTYLTGITGGTKVGLLGSSMGGAACLSWSRKWPAKVAGTFLVAPFIDLDGSRGTPGWVAPYSVQPGDPNDDLTYVGGVDSTNLQGSYKVSVESDWVTNAVNQGHTPARYPQDWAGQKILIAHAHRDAGIPYQMSQWWVSAVNSSTVRFRPVTAAAALHEPETLLIGGAGASDDSVRAAGGLPRSEIRDFFHSVF